MKKTILTIDNSVENIYGLENAKSHYMTGTIEYVPHSVVSKAIIKKLTGNVSMLAFDSGQQVTEKSCRFDIFLQIIEGKAEIIISDISNIVKTGESIIIPAHCPHTIKANERFKILSVIIKSGYEE